MSETSSMEKQRIAYSPDAAQFIYVRPYGDDEDEGFLAEIECVNRGSRTEVWLDEEGTRQLADALKVLAPRAFDEKSEI